MKYEKLIDLEFTKIGCWKTDDDDLNYEVFENKSNANDRHTFTAVDETTVTVTNMVSFFRRRIRAVGD